MLPQTRDEPCPLCGGRGWVIEPDAGAGAARPCSCREQDRALRLLDAAGIPPRYRHCRLSNFQTSSPSPAERGQLQGARRLAEHYVEGFLQEGGFRQSGLLFVGPPGTGKTHLAVGVLVELIERLKVHGRFAEFTSLIHQIQATFDPGSPESKREILDPLMGAELLVLDEPANGLDPAGMVAIETVSERLELKRELFARLDRIDMDLDRVGAVLEVVGHGDGLVRQLAVLPDRHEPGRELVRHRAAQDEAAGLEPHHHVDGAAGVTALDGLARGVVAAHLRQEVAAQVRRRAVPAPRRGELVRLFGAQLRVLSVVEPMPVVP